MERREALGTLLAGAATAALPKGGTPAVDEPAAKPGSHAIRPLPFDPKKLEGLSEKLVASHHDNNYAGAVKNLNKVEAQLAGLAKDAPPFLVSGLKEKELVYGNSLAFHELYFGNLGGDGKASGSLTKALAESFGSMGAWEEQFRALGSSLGGGSGWATLTFNFHTGELENTWAGGHANAPAFAAPLLVMDMFEHAYQMDYGAAAARYIDAFFRNLQWGEVQRRFEAATRMAKALKA
jgi:Fe-Mn family superoxide dismutase